MSSTAKKVPFTVTEDAITVFLKGKTHTVRNDHQNFYALRLALKHARWADVPELLSVRETFNRKGSGRVVLDEDGEVVLDGHPLHSSLATRIMQMFKEGHGVGPMIAFYNNLLANPSKASIKELYDFLTKNKLPITEDGHFLAYKKIDTDWKDFYTHSIDNSIGALVTMPRPQVNDDRHQTCSVGLHFCSLEYLPAYHGGSGRVVVVKINPANVVSIPTDYNNAKGRCCEYLVVREHTTGERSESLTRSVYMSDGSDFDYTDRDVVDEGDIVSLSDFRFNAEGFDKDGFNAEGYNVEGYDRAGFNIQGYDKDGRDMFDAKAAAEAVRVYAADAPAGGFFVKGDVSPATPKFVPNRDPGTGRFVKRKTGGTLRTPGTKRPKVKGRKRDANGRFSK